MNRALLYLWVTLLKRRVLRFGSNLRRPTSLVGFATVVGFLAFLFNYRHEEIFAQLVRKESLVGCALIMCGGSLLAGFGQRGLLFELPDLEFLFTAPFTRRQIILYRLLPGYLYAVIQSMVFLAIFATHLKHPLLMAACLILFQIACFHISSAAAIFAGTIPEDLHYRLRWMMVAFFAFIAAFYFKIEWDLRIVPAFLALPLAQTLFYPAVNLPDLSLAQFVPAWATYLAHPHFSWTRELWQAALYLAGFATVAAVTLWFLLKIKGDIFEASLATTSVAAEKRLRLQQGHSSGKVTGFGGCSVHLPTLSVFRGVGAIVWKNLVVASRSRRELALAAAFTLIYTGTLVALRWALRHVMESGGELPPSEVRAFDASLVSLLFFLPYFLQRTFPFDFRRDGQHLIGFRTLPVGALALTLAELAVPTFFCLAFQAIGFVILLSFARFEWYRVLLLVMVYPTVVFGLNCIWNLHYLLAATKRAGNKAESTSPVGMIIVVALSFCVFLPAIWVGQFLGHRIPWPIALPIGFAAAVAVQCLVDFLLFLLLAKIFQNFELSPDRQ